MSHTIQVRRPVSLTVALLVGALLAPVASSPPARAGHGPFPVSTAIYRIPYADGTQLTVTQDHHNHGPGNNQGNNRIDMIAGAPPPRSWPPRPGPSWRSSTSTVTPTATATVWTSTASPVSCSATA